MFRNGLVDSNQVLKTVTLVSAIDSCHHGEKTSPVEAIGAGGTIEGDTSGGGTLGAIVGENIGPGSGAVVGVVGGGVGFARGTPTGLVAGGGTIGGETAGGTIGGGTEGGGAAIGGDCRSARRPP